MLGTDTADYMDMSPMVLADSPIAVPEKTFEPDAVWDTLYTFCEQRLGTLRSWRWSWWVHWAILARYFLPRRYHWVVVANRLTKGRPINDEINDSSPTIAMRTCASGMWAGLTNPARPWIVLGAPKGIEIDADGKQWYSDTARDIEDVLSESNFYTEMAQGFQDLTVFGQDPHYIYEDYEDIIRLYTPCAGEYYLGVGARLEVDTIYREFTFTVLQIVEMFGFDNCPESVQKQFEEGQVDQEYVVAHAAEPNFPIASKEKRGKKLEVLPEHFTFREVYWLKGNKTEKPLSLRGFHEKPFFVPRASKVSNEPYARSFCMDALPDNLQVQQETLRKGEFLEKGVRPPMGAPVELKNEPASIMPGMITYGAAGANGKIGFHPLFEVNPAWLDGITKDIALVSSRVDRCLFVDVFMAITQMAGVQPRNELELTKRDLERLQQLGPVIELVENALADAIRRVLSIMARRKRLRPMPQSVRKAPLKITFVSIMRIAQRAAEGVNLKDFLATMGEASEAAKAAGLPDPLRKVNLDKWADELADANNVPPHIMFTDAEVLEHDKARSQATQQAQTPQNLMAAVTAAKGLSETSMAPGSALSALTGGGGGNPAAPAGG